MSCAVSNFPRAMHGTPLKPTVRRGGGRLGTSVTNGTKPGGRLAARSLDFGFGFSAGAGFGVGVGSGLGRDVEAGMGWDWDRE